MRLFFCGGPYDGGQADHRVDVVPTGSKRARRQQRPELPQEAYVARDGSWYCWLYRRSRVITPYSASYNVVGFVKVSDVAKNAVLVLLPADS